MQVYKIQNTINEKLYVGITTETLKKRFYRHTRAVNRGSSLAIHNAMRKHGPENFQIIEIDQAETLKELYEKEMYWVQILDAYKNGYNETIGGKGTIGRVMSEEQKQNLRNIRAKKYWAGHTNKHSDEAKQKISNAAKKTFLQKGRGATKGYIKSEETKRKISESKKGKKKPVFDWEITKPTGEIITTNNLSDFCALNKLSVGNMSWLASGKLKYYKGYRCKKIGSIKGHNVQF